MRAALSGALTDAERLISSRPAEDAAGTPGFYLEFQLAPGAGDAAEKLEDRRKNIELVAVRHDLDQNRTMATVFVPQSSAQHFVKKVDAYRTEQTTKGRPKNEALVARVDAVALAAVRSVYTDEVYDLPPTDEKIWWEIWIRSGRMPAFEHVTRRLEIPVSANHLQFPEREVRLAYADVRALGNVLRNSDSIAEVRRANDTPSLFVGMSNAEQRAWTQDLTDRIIPVEGDGIAVCLLDRGVTEAHPLLVSGVAPEDVHVYDPTWLRGNPRGHGTQMAGVVLYGDLQTALADTQPLRLTHRLESVKIIPDDGENEPRLYGAITVDSIAQAEIQAPHRRRAICMAVTSAYGTHSGRPSSWSAEVDQLCFGDPNYKRLMLVSAGNIWGDLKAEEYLSRNDLESVESPAQSWNAITVGACTDKVTLTDADYEGWNPLAPVGGLCPTSRTSVGWQRQWPVKPDVVAEGGNFATLNGSCDAADDLAVLTTFHDLSRRHFDIFRDTSAATAFMGNLAGRILARVPDCWPETIRGLIIHSAEWTPAMLAQVAAARLEGASPEKAKRMVLRRFGYGVPSYERTVFSTINDLTLIAEDQLQPFWKDPEDRRVKTRHMNLHRLPWPRAELEQLGDTDVELRVTLSYYIEPNPGERGWQRKHRYQSHALRFEVQRPLETVDAFRVRINKAAKAEEEGNLVADTGGDDWFLGRLRNAGSIHSDYWRGSAVDLAQRSAIAVYPIAGWWKENPSHKRFENTIRYSLIVSIRATNGIVDIYTPVLTQITLPTQITI